MNTILGNQNVLSDLQIGPCHAWIKRSQFVKGEVQSRCDSITSVAQNDSVCVSTLFQTFSMHPGILVKGRVVVFWCGNVSHITSDDHGISAADESMDRDGDRW